MPFLHSSKTDKPTTLDLNVEQSKRLNIRVDLAEGPQLSLSHSHSLRQQPNLQPQQLAS